IIGDGSLKSHLIDATRQVRGISLQSFVSDSYQLAANYRAADIFVHPGVHETFGLVTLEAQACGLPVIGIRGTFMDALAFVGVEHWASGNTADSLAAAISSFSLLPMREIGSGAACIAHERYSWPQVFGRIFQLYETALQEL